jgi:hypothetical protein
VGIGAQNGFNSTVKTLLGAFSEGSRMQFSLLRAFIVSGLMLAPVTTIRGDELPSDAAKRIKEYEGKVVAIKKQATEAVAVAQAKLIEDLKVVQSAYAKGDFLDAALETREYIKIRQQEKAERIPDKGLPSDTAMRVQKYEAEAVAIGDKADASIKAELDKAIEDLKGLQSANTRAEKLDEAQTIRARIELLRARESEVSRFQGKWAVVRWQTQGRKFHDSGTILTIKGERIYFESNHAPAYNINPYRFTPIPSTDPSQIDVNKQPGIYRFGDFKDPEHELAIWWNGVRPTEFLSAERLADMLDIQRPTILLLKRVRD